MMLHCQEIDNRMEEERDWKISFLQSTAGNANTLSSIKNTTKEQIRGKSISVRKVAQKPTLDRRLSQHVL